MSILHTIFDRFLFEIIKKQIKVNLLFLVNSIIALPSEKFHYFKALTIWKNVILLLYLSTCYFFRTMVNILLFSFKIKDN